MKNIYFYSVMVIAFTITGSVAYAQAKLVINGGIITLNGASLVVDNPDNTAITRNGSGYIKSEAAGNKIIWTIGAGNGKTYIIPFGNAAGYFPIQFMASSGTGNNAQFIFSTYPTPSWKNSDNLPPGVTNLNKDGKDNSAKVIDRFWQISPQGYITNPTLSHLQFTYSGTEYSTPNTIIEGNLAAQRWNPARQSWTDYNPASVTDSINNTVSINSVAGGQLYNWWTLADQQALLAVNLINFKAFEKGAGVLTIWQTLSEQNMDHFEVWRSKDGVQYEYLGNVAAAGNSNSTNTYSFTDPNPYPGISYYKLKIIDKSGGFAWSMAVLVKIDKIAVVVLYPNPAGNYIIINSSSEIVNSKPVVRLYNAQGELLQIFILSAINQQVNISNLAAGTYQVNIYYNNEVKTIRFIKK